MTVNAETPWIRHQGDGVATEFAFQFTIYEATQIEVMEVVRATGAQQEKVLGADYSVAINAAGLPGGAVIAAVPPASTRDWVLWRKLPLDQQTTLSLPYLREVETRLDKVVGQIQDLRAAVDRCLRLPDSDPALAALPVQSVRANGFPFFDAAGVLTLVAALLPGVTTVSAFGASLVDDIDAPTARATLGMAAFQFSGSNVGIGKSPAVALDVNGTIAGGKLQVDANFYLDLATDPRLVADANDYLTYDRTNNRWLAYVGGVSQGGFGAGGLRLKDGNEIDGIATQAEMEAGASLTRMVTPGRQIYHPSAAKVWVKFDASSGVPAINRSFNVSSITDHGAGDYSINYAIAFSDVHYASTLGGRLAGLAGTYLMENHDNVVRTTTAIRVYSLNGGGAPTDAAVFSYIAVGDL